MTRETKVYTYRSGARLMGRSYIFITCPFCQAEVRAYVWSLAGKGKRCPCGALHTWLGGVTIREVPSQSPEEAHVCQE